MKNNKKKLAVVLGIRPDVIRASLVLNSLRKCEEFETVFIWSGQHYSDNLKDIFFRELKVDPPEIELGVEGSNDSEVVAGVISKLYPLLEKIKPEAVVFLGDTNTVMGCLAAAQLNIPIVHIEGCMRSYDWRMPEEKYRTTIDHLADVIYAYFDEYKEQGIAEGINPKSIVVVQNLIVDVLQEYYFKRKNFYQSLASTSFFKERQLEIGKYYLMTCHRRENVHEAQAIRNIASLMAASPHPIIFPASYRTQRVLKEEGIVLPKTVRQIDPIGYVEMLTLVANSRGVITDSGTVVEETAVLQVPSVQMRKSTERPQVYDAKSSVKFDPTNPIAPDLVFRKLESLFGTTWEHNLGDGKASERVVNDLKARMATPDGFRLHRPEDYHVKIARSYSSDGIQ